MVVSEEDGGREVGWWTELLNGDGEDSYHNVLLLVSVWAPIVAIYIMDIQIWYSLLSAIIGGVTGARGRLGEIRSIEMVHKRFKSYPEAFVKKLVSTEGKSASSRISMNAQSLQNPEENKDKMYAAQFSPFWNEIIKSLREEDLISNRQATHSFLFFAYMYNKL
ncbi:callose synthase 10-like [Bidens hawaiensis]|uniref:callose synthase 10-like n=1 Tax=Bidens hawaiensis TaxID=980011 RepID=UPI00404A020C